MDIPNFYRTTLGLTNEKTIRLLSENTREVSHKAGEYIFRSGDPLTTMYFHLSGVTKGYFITEDGRETIFGFSKGGYGEPCIADSALSATARNYVFCLTDVESLALPVNVLVQAIKTDREAAFIYEQLMKQDADKHLNSQIQITNLSGKEKYLWFLEEYKNVAERIPLMDVAAFLGLKPQSLSRIRASLSQETTEKE